MTRSPLVLMYHAIGTRPPQADPHNLFVPAEAFEAQLRTLRGSGWHFLDADAWLRGLQRGHWPRRSVLITFDDGYLGTASLAVPALHRHRASAVVFVCPGKLGGTSDWMTETQEPLLDAAGVRGLFEAGLEVGAHGVDHRSLRGCDPAELAAQVGGSAAALEGVLGHRPRMFAYPYGDHDEAARSAVASAGLDAAFATYDGGSGRYDVCRVDVNARDTPRTFRLKTAAGYPLLRRQASRAPRVRAALHRAIGHAERH